MEWWKIFKEIPVQNIQENPASNNKEEIATTKKVKQNIWTGNLQKRNPKETNKRRSLRSLVIMQIKTSAISLYYTSRN